MVLYLQTARALKMRAAKTDVQTSPYGARVPRPFILHLPVSDPFRSRCRRARAPTLHIGLHSNVAIR